MAARRGEKSSSEGNGSSKGRSLPAARVSGRKVIVVLGADEDALAATSRILHALGADMIEPGVEGGWTPDQGEWSRAWAGELNSRLLEMIGRPEGHVAHALPLPAGWWRRPGVQQVTNEIVAELERSVSHSADMWGLACATTARLLPVWHDAFERLNLTPVYLWVITDPAWTAPPRGGARRDAAPAELRWLAYNTDIHRYAGEAVAAVIDHAEWEVDPHNQIERLTRALPLRWRGTSLELFETVSAVLAGFERPDQGRRSAPVLPLSLRFYGAALQSAEDPAARAEVETIVQGVELLRPLLAPFLSDAGRPDATDTGEVDKLRTEVMALRQTLGDLRREQQPSGEEASSPPDATLRQELEARETEIRWLHEQYRERLRHAEAEIAGLRGAGEAVGDAGRGRVANAEELQSAAAEIERLKSELTTQANANERYLARIYELKNLLKAAENPAGAGD